jgi:hypothetical protein
MPSPACVVKVGEGRGFVIGCRLKLKDFRVHRLVVTAAHCLPKLPPADAAAYSSNRTYQKLGTLDGRMNGVWAECLFVNSVADIAVLGCPDDQECFHEAESYDVLTDGPVLRIEKARSGRGWMLSLNGHWIPTTLNVFSDGWGSSLWIDPTESGMSGSPILNGAGRAVGVVAVAAETLNASGQPENESAGPQPVLASELPGWLLQNID